MVTEIIANPPIDRREKARRALTAAGIVCVLCWVGSYQTPGWKERTVAAVLVAEAGGEGQAGMQAVAEVMLNRHVRSRRPIIEIVLQPSVFSCLNMVSRDRLCANTSRHPRFGEALEIARVLLRHPESLPRRVNGADHYAAAGSHPTWAEGIKPVAVVGRHVFWRLDS